MAALARPLTLVSILLTTLFALAAPGCDDAASAKTLSVNISGKKFLLEVADTGPIRTKGLGQRDHIDADGGMLFLMPDQDVRVQSFIMRDCPVAIDIIYLDSRGRVLTTYAMTPEAPRTADEGKVGDWESSGGVAYDRRLRSYSSRFPSQFIIELKGGTLETLKVSSGDTIQLDWEALRRRAR